MHCLPAHFPILRIQALPLDDLVYLQAARNYTLLYFEDGSSEVYAKTLKLFEASLPAEHFVRISKSYLIRRDYIRTHLSKSEILLQNGLRLKVARRRKMN
jgi:DNA-binding LytR/AlgR family response regulator